MEDMMVAQISKIRIFKEKDQKYLKPPCLLKIYLGENW